LSIDEVFQRKLTREQREAAEDKANEVICLACAGSGKSRTLAYRIARLLSEGEKPESIVAFTFTEKAADSIKRNVAKALDEVGIDTDVMGAMYIGTIHSYCQYVLGEINPVYRQYEVLDDNRLKLYLMSRYPELNLVRLRRDGVNRGRKKNKKNGEETEIKYFEVIKQVSNAWKVINDEAIAISDVRSHDPNLGAALEKLNACLQRDQYIDFSLMIRRVVEAFEGGNQRARSAVDKLKHLMVDEYQDVCPSQEALIVCLHELSETLFVVGDDDQAIYSWRGADVSNILSFKKDFPNASEHTLAGNFRSTSTIVEVSNAFIAAELGPSRIDKHPYAVENKSPRDFKVLWFPDRNAEAQWVAERIQTLLGTAYEEDGGLVRGLTYADFAILMRSTRSKEQNTLPRHTAFTRALEKRDIRYSLEAGGGPFDRPQVRVLRGTFELLRNSPLTRDRVQKYFENIILPAYPRADFNTVVRVLTQWGRNIHAAQGGTRQRIYPQQILFEILDAFRIRESDFPDDVMRDIGLFSRMIQDIEAVYMSVDDPQRFASILNFLRTPAETGYNVSTDDVVRKPNAVTVSTVHQVKGLEFPVVFIVDVEAERFPDSRRGYNGWLPKETLTETLERGAYQGGPIEEARLFYTAITRAERYLHVSGAELLPNAKKGRTRSSFANRLIQEDITNSEVSTDLDGIPEGLTPCPERQRIDETVLPTNFSEIRYYLRCPMDYRFRKGYGFTPAIPELFGFGETVHTIIQKLHVEFPDNIPISESTESIARTTFHLKHVPRSRDPISRPGPWENAENKAVDIAQKYIEEYRTDFQRIRQVEARFEIPAQDCVISGSIDLLLKQDSEGNTLEAEVIDFKAMQGGDVPVENEELEWTELSLQVQLYAKAAADILGENARTGSVHLLKDNVRQEVPVSDEAISAAINNVEWAVCGIIEGDYPMRPHPDKCEKCDFKILCPRTPEPFTKIHDIPPKIHLPGGKKHALVFSQFEEGEPEQRD